MKFSIVKLWSYYDIAVSIESIDLSNLSMSLGKWSYFTNLKSWAHHGDDFPIRNYDSRVRENSEVALFSPSTGDLRTNGELVRKDLRTNHSGELGMKVMPTWPAERRRRLHGGCDLSIIPLTHPGTHSYLFGIARIYPKHLHFIPSKLRAISFDNSYMPIFYCLSWLLMVFQFIVRIVGDITICW